MIVGSDLGCMRCVNIDWLEVYCEENNNRFPCNAEYFERQGYQVSVREYGTRVYNEMFTILDESGNPLIEIRRNPQSGESDFHGLSEFSTHIRLVNWACYLDKAVSILRDFLARHDYIFRRIYRLDLAYDFEYFDTGDKPARVARRIMEKTYLKMNQTKLYAIGDDNWSTYEWETLSWGSPSSMVSTKMYNKSKELAAQGNKKPYILSQWMMCGLIDNPVTQVKHKAGGQDYKPDIWRIEFSLKSKADSWLILENNKGKRMKKQAVRHSLLLFDSKDKLWQRFQDLAFHYFRFKVKEYKKPSRGVVQHALDAFEVKQEFELKRKDRLPDKVLFHWDKNREFLHVQQLPKPSKPDNPAAILRRRLIHFAAEHPDPKVRQACDTIINTIDVREVYRYTDKFDIWQVKALQAVIQLKMGGDERSTVELIAELEELFKKEQIW